MRDPKLLYVINQYPAISHTFISAEIEGLEANGLQIIRQSINTPDRPTKQLSEQEALEESQTTYLKKELKSRPHTYLSEAMKSPKQFSLALRLLAASATTTGRRKKNLGYFLAGLVTAYEAKKEGVDLIHAHFSTQACSIAMFASALSGIPYTVTVHGPDEFYDVAGYDLSTKYERAHHVIAISEFARSQVLKYSELKNWDKVSVNKLGVDTDKFVVSEKTTNQNNSIEVLCLGRLVSAKGQGVLLRAARDLKAKGLEISYTIAGDGPDREELESFAKSHDLRIKFLGNVNPDQIPKLMSTADIFVLPSFAEGIPVVLMEAMATGLPCISTRITGIGELITSGVDGVLVAAGDATELSKQIADLAEDSELRNKLGLAAATTIRQSWRLDKSNQRLCEIFRNTLTNKA